MTPKELSVWVGPRRVGTLVYEDHSFVYRYESPNRLQPNADLVSLTMPVRARSYATQLLPPPFQSVLPEGDLLLRLRSRFAKVLNLDDDFELLRLVGRNTIGRVTFGSADAGADAPAADLAHYDLNQLLKHPDIKELLDELIEQYGIVSGLGGIQPKVLLANIDRQVALPTEMQCNWPRPTIWSRSPSTWQTIRRR